MTDCAPPPSLLDGLSQDQLRAELAKAQQAYLALMRGDKGVNYTYTQGDGAKGVTYQPTNPAQLVQLIRQIKAALGLDGGRRRPLRPTYGWR